jgi:hypothetical protein
MLMKKKLSSLFLCTLILVAIPSFSLFAGEGTSQNETNQQNKQKTPKSLLKIISVNLNNVPLEKALSVIAEKGEFEFNYNRSRIPVNKNVSVKMDNVPVIEVLNKILEDTGTELAITGAGQFAIIPAKNQSTEQQKIRRGKIKGQVLDRETKEPLPGVHVEIVNTQQGTIADKLGNFMFNDIVVGNYSILFSLPGFDKLLITDVIVRSKRITTVQAELKLLPIKAEVVVSAKYFAKNEDQPAITANFSTEEVRRAPTLLSDVSRRLMGLPSVINMNQQFNGLIVRGGSPSENGFFVDGIEIPNINHFPIQGSSAGLLSIMNIDLINNVDFYAGGFSAKYGNRLSSFTDLTLREGNRDELDFQLDLSLAGVGATAEGSLGGGKGSWLFSARRSFFSFLVDVTGLGDEDDTYPEYDDFQAKLVYDISPNHRISVLNLFGVDNWNIPGSEFDDESIDIRMRQNTAGISWRYLWGSHGYSDTSISHVICKYNLDFIEEDVPTYIKNTQDQEFRLRNVNHFRINPSHKLDFGVEAKILKSEFDESYGEYFDVVGNLSPEGSIKQDIETQKYAAFISYSWKPFSALTVTSGIRADHFGYNKDTHISPRLSFTYNIGKRTSIHGASGIYYQNVPLVLICQKDEFKNLRNPRAYHYVFGIRHFLTEDTRLTVEIYNKQYDRFPLDTNQPSLFIMDEPAYMVFFVNHDNLVSSGKARSYGIELMIQKKFTNKFYGLLGGALYRSRYRDLNGVWRNRIYDNRYNATVEAGYIPNNKWEFSMSWIFAGGMPYTPYDAVASSAIDEPVFDVNAINSRRFPDHNSLSVRFDRRFNFSGSNLICFFSIWNVFNKRTPNETDWSQYSEDHHKP